MASDQLTGRDVGKKGSGSNEFTYFYQALLKTVHLLVGQTNNTETLLLSS